MPLVMSIITYLRIIQVSVEPTLLEIDYVLPITFCTIWGRVRYQAVQKLGWEEGQELEQILDGQRLIIKPSVALKKSQARRAMT